MRYSLRGTKAPFEKLNKQEQQKFEVNDLECVASPWSNVANISHRIKRQPNPKNNATSLEQQHAVVSSRTTTGTLISTVGTQTHHTNVIASPMDLNWHLNYDGNIGGSGLTWLLGTKFYTVPWENPVQSGLLIASSSSTEKASLLQPAVLPVDIFGGQVESGVLRCQTSWNGNNSCFTLGLGSKRTMKIFRYCMRGTSLGGNDCLVDWEFQGRSHATNKWVVLRSHVGDMSIFETSRSVNSGHKWLTWLIDEQARNVDVDAVRILMTGVNTNGNARLTMSGLELFGVLHDPDKPFGVCIT